jgi:hypothetical protein
MRSRRSTPPCPLCLCLWAMTRRWPTLVCPRTSPSTCPQVGGCPRASWLAGRITGREGSWRERSCCCGVGGTSCISLQHELSGACWTKPVASPAS